MPTVVDIVLQDMFQLPKSLSMSLGTQLTGDSLGVKLSWPEMASSAAILGCYKIGHNCEKERVFQWRKAIKPPTCIYTTYWNQGEGKFCSGWGGFYAGGLSGRNWCI
jgi:hypothetical protein